MMKRNPENFAVINKNIDKAKSLPFMSEHSSFSSLKLEQMSATQFEKQSGYELWRRRLGHSSNRNLRDSIKWSTGLEDLKRLTYEEHVKCLSCMIGKATWTCFHWRIQPCCGICRHIYWIQMDLWNEDQRSDDQCCKEVVQLHCRFTG